MRPTILIVTADAAARDALAGLLRRAGYATAEASDVCQAVWRLEQTAGVRLVLLDVMLPHMSAWALLRAWRDGPARAAVPVALLAEPGLLRPPDAAAMGALALLEKPVGPRPLLQAVRQSGRGAAEERREKATA
jgi:CheY-like chemotaxis protein